MKHSVSAVLEIIDITYNNLMTDESYEVRRQIDLSNFKDEFAKLKFSLPRRQGSTTAAISTVLHFNGSLLVVPNVAIRDNVLGELRNKAIPFKESNIITFRNLHNMADNPSNKIIVNILVIDTCKMLNSKELDYIYNIMKHRCTLYVEFN